MTRASLDSTEVINTNELLARCMGNVDFATRVLAKFQDRFGQDLEQLERELVDCNKDAIVLVAHRIKGVTANISAPQLHQWAAEIEQLGRDDRIAEIYSGLEELRNEWSRFNASVSTLTWAQHDGC